MLLPNTQSFHPPLSSLSQPPVDVSLPLSLSLSLFWVRMWATPPASCKPVILRGKELHVLHLEHYHDDNDDIPLFFPACCNEHVLTDFNNRVLPTHLVETYFRLQFLNLKKHISLNSLFIGKICHRAIYKWAHVSKGWMWVKGFVTELHKLSDLIVKLRWGCQNPSKYEVFNLIFRTQK